MQATIIKYLTDKDPVLGEIIASIPYPNISSTGDMFHDLMSLAVEQQIHYRSTKHIFKKVMQKAGLKRLTLADMGTFVDEGLSTTKMAENKYDAIAHIVDFFESNKPNWASMSDAEVRKMLKQIKGVGAKSIDMILLYTLERPDIFIANDYHLQPIMIQLYEVDTTAKVNAQLKAIAAQWSPYQSTAVKYLLAWKTHQKQIKL